MTTKPAYLFYIESQRASSTLAPTANTLLRKKDWTDAKNEENLFTTLKVIERQFNSTDSVLHTPLMELVDMPDLGSGAARFKSSSLLWGT